MRHPIELELAYQRQAEHRAAAQRDARIHRAESRKPADGHRVPGLRLSFAR